MKVFFFMAHPGHLRNFESTVRCLSERRHEVTVLFDSGREGTPAHEALILELASSFSKLSFRATPRRRRGREWTGIASKLRASIDCLRFRDPRLKCAVRFRARAERAAPLLVRLAVRSPPARSDRVRRAMRASLQWLESTVPLVEPLVKLLRDERPDIVLVTPLVDLGSPQVDQLRCAKALEIPTVLCVASWDNLTTGGLIQEVPDLVTVWNEDQRREAIELHGVPPDRLAVTGAPGYDHWFDWAPTLGREELCRLAGLSSSRPFALYLCSSEFLVPDEERFLLGWLRQLWASERDGLRDIGVLVRPHPSRPLHRWGSAHAFLTALSRVSLWPPSGHDPIDRDAKAAYFDSIYHSTAVVGANTSALIESAIVGREVCTLLAPELSSAQQGSPHFAYLSDPQHGLVTLARNYEEHLRQLEEAVHSSGDRNSRGTAFLRRFVRPRGMDRPAAAELVTTIEATAGRPAISDEARPGRGAVVLRPALTAVGRLALLMRRRPAEPPEFRLAGAEAPLPKPYP